MSGFDLIINEDFSEKIFRESYMNEGNQQDFIRVLFQYPSIQINKATLSFANTLSLFSQTFYFSLQINPYCFLSKESYEQIAIGIDSHMNNVVKLNFQFGGYCGLTDLSFFSILKNLRNKLKEFSFELGEQNTVDDEQFQHLGSFIQNQQTLDVLKIKINERNYFTNSSFIHIAKSLSALENLSQLSIDLNMSRIDESTLCESAILLIKLKHLNTFEFKDNSTNSLFFPGIQPFLRTIISLTNLQTVNITFMSHKLLKTNDALEFFEGISNLKYLKKLVLKGFNLSQVDFGNANYPFLSQKDSLKVLELDFDSISQRNGLLSFLQKDLQHLTNLKEFNLNISKHSFIQESGCIQISECVSKMILLEKLNLQIQLGNKIGQEGLYSIGKAITNLSFLSHLDLFIDDQNDQEKNGLKHLFEGFNSLINLIEFKFKLLCKKSIGSSEVYSFLGETFSSLKQIKILDIFIESKYITLKNIERFCSGLSTLTDLRELKGYFKSYRLDNLESSIFQAIQNFKQLEIMRVSCNQTQELYTEIQIPLIGRLENLIELHMTFEIGRHHEDTKLIKEGFESIKQLKFLSLKFVVRRFYFFRKKMQQMVEDFVIPSSVESFKFEFKSSQTSGRHLSTQFHKMFAKLKNLKILILNFDHQGSLHSANDISQCLMHCQSLTSLSLRLRFFLLQKDIEFISEGISSLVNLRQLSIDIPYLAIIDQTQTQQLKDAIGSLKKLSIYNQNIKFLEKPETQQYDHLVKLPNLVSFNQNKQNFQDFDEQNMTHLATSKYDCIQPIELQDINNLQRTPKDNNDLVTRHLTQLDLVFFNNMTPLCYIEILENLKHFKQLKELTFTFSSEVYLSRQEISHIRIGLSKLINLTSLSVQFNFENKDCIINKKMIYALGVGLQQISQLENLTLDILKQTDTSHSDYFAKLARGIKNQKKLLNLQLKMNGLNWLEWQSFNLNDVLKNTGKLKTLRLTFSDRFTENNLIQLGDALSFQNQLISLTINLSSENYMSNEAALLLNKGIKQNNHLQSLILNLTDSHTGDNSSLNHILDKKNSENEFLQDLNVRFLVEDKISTEVLEKEILQIEKFKHLKQLKYEILFSQNNNVNKHQDQIEVFFENLFNTIQLPNCLSIECSVPHNNLKRIETNLKMITNDQCNFQFLFKYDSALVENSLDLLIPLSKIKEITKLRCCFPQYQNDQSNNFLKNSHHLSNILEFHLLIQNQASFDDLYDNFALGIKQMVNLRSISLWFLYRMNFNVNTLNLLFSSLSELKHLSTLKISKEYSNYYITTGSSKQQSLNTYFRLSQLTNLKYLEIDSFDSLVSTNILSRYFKRKMIKLVSTKLNTHYCIQSPNIIQQFQNDDL